MDNAKDDDFGCRHPIVNHVRISYEWDTTYARTFGDFLSTLGELFDPFDNPFDTCANAHCSRGIFRGDPLKNILKFGKREPRVSDLHARRYFAKTASTSSSLATSPRSTAAKASSIARSSSDVA